MILKRRSIRLRVALLVLVPLVCLIGLSGYEVTKSASSALTLIRSRVLLTDIGPPVASLQAALTAERAQMIVSFAQPTSSAVAGLQAREAATDRAVGSFLTATNSSSVRQDASAGGKKAIAGMRRYLAGLAGLRQGITGHSVTGQQAFETYNGMIAASYQILEQAIIQEGSSTQELPKIAVIELAISNEYLQQESALLAGDFAAGAFPASAYQAFVSLVGAHRLLYAQSYSYLDPADRAGLNHDVDQRVAGAVTAFENKVVGAGARRTGPPVRASTWNRDVATLSAQVQRAVGEALARLVAEARSQEDATLRGLYLTGAVALAAVIVSLLLSLWIAINLARQLHGLRDSALEMANVRLPALVQRLRDGEDVDVAEQAPQLEAGADELGQVKAAFNTAQRTAVEAAVDLARMRRGISDVFRNLARRSQSLLARQMMLLDTLERAAAEPEDMENLFRIDHLTTRMRRHAESLLVMAGDLPERTFLEPVPFVDVLRAAAAEVEDYTRIRVVSRPPAALIGPAVSDVVHMLAEFLENATRFSPPPTEVRVTGNLVARGYAIDIEDRGLGMTETELLAVNAELAQPPTFDLPGSDRMGLVVAAQLAHRHSIRVTMRGSPYGGLEVIVLIPPELVVRSDALDRGALTGPLNGTGAPAGGQEPATTPPNGSRAGLGPVPGPRPVPASPSGLGPHPEARAGTAEPAMTTGRHAVSSLQSNGASPAGPPSYPVRPVPRQPLGDGLPAGDGPGDDDLPQRVRQGSIAPQLRDSTFSAAPTAPPDGSRSPEAARSLMSAFWHGRQRGLSEAGLDQEDRAAFQPEGEGR
jgi:signal transduction histidine kinase